jgi:large subunit ribosomal protein L1
MSFQITNIEKTLQDVMTSSEIKKKRNFVEAVDVIINLKNVNLKDPNKRFNNEIELPNPVNANTSICFLVDGDQQVQAEKLQVDAVNKDQLDEIG